MYATYTASLRTLNTLSYSRNENAVSEYNGLADAVAGGAGRGSCPRVKEEPQSLTKIFYD